jgi:hypothetical protein
VAIRQVMIDSTAGVAPRVVLGMTLHNQARHLPAALESLLAQSHEHFMLVMLDDGSQDGTEAIARQYAARDARVRYHRRGERQGMIATWHGVVELARRECPTAVYFAWASDHDRWHRDWLARLYATLESSPRAVLAYPLTQRMTPDGEAIDKEPRRFDTEGLTDVRARWRRFCRNGAGAGDMVYGLMRLAALGEAGIFRQVLRPDRLLIAELVLRGEIRQVPEVLWFRRNTATSSVARQAQTLLLPGTAPSWFWWPPWMQHARVFRHEYRAGTLRQLGLTTSEWRRMRAWYQLTYGWRHARKSETSYLLGRGLDRVVSARKLAKHYYHHAVYRTLVMLHAATDRVRQRPPRPDVPGKSEPM